MLIPTNFLKHDSVLHSLPYEDKEYYSINELLQLTKDDKEKLYYVKEQFHFSQANNELYLQLLNIQSSQDVLYSKDIIHSQSIFNSENVNNSKSIHKSTEIKNSEVVVGSDVVNNSSQVFLSSFVDNSNKITSSLTVDNSTNIVHSQFIVNSSNVYESTNVIDSNIVFRGVNLEDCYFCNNSKDLKHCICCSGVSGGEYLIFNTKVDTKMFEIIKKQFVSMMDCLLKFTNGWPVVLTTAETPVIDRNFVRHYETIPQKFWKWVKTLPNYSDTHMFYLTSLPEFLTK